MSGNDEKTDPIIEGENLAEEIDVVLTPEKSEEIVNDVFTLELPDVTPESTEYLDSAPSATVEADGGDTLGDSVGVVDDAVERVRGTLDDKGVAFDPALHSYPPEKTAGGKWRRIPKAQREGIPEAQQIPPNAANRMEAQKMAFLYAGSHTIFFGAKGGAINPDEILPLVDATERYFNENGVIKTPPALDLALSAGVYSLTVSQRPSNVEKTAAFFSKIKGWFKSLKKPKLNSRKVEAEKGDDSA